MPTTHVVLFTRDLRVHDHPALAAAVDAADHVVPLFVLDDAILGSSYAAPNRCQFLLDSLADLRHALLDRGGALVLRRGDVAEQVRAVVQDVDAEVVHLTRDVSAYARRREQRLGRAVEGLACEVVTHPGHLLVEPGEVTPTGGDHFKVFTPYWRRWKDAPHRPPVPAPDAVSLPSIELGALPALADLVDDEPSPEVQRGGETRARARLDGWLDGPIAEYEESRNDLADPDGTSRLSAHLHLGTVSVAEIVDRLDLADGGTSRSCRSCAGASSTTSCSPPPRRCRMRTTARSTTTGWTTTTRSPRGARDAPGTRSSTPGCASCAARATCPTARA